MTQTSALITGAAAPGGIGMACARALGRAGHRLIITASSGRIEARQAEPLAEGYDVAAFQGDLTDPAMVAQGCGRVVMRASVAGPLVSNPGESASSAVKAAMVGLTHALALEVGAPEVGAPEVGAQGVTVNAVAPGWIATEAATSDEMRAALTTPLARAGSPDEVAACVAVLASRAASYVNRATLVVEGGNSLQERKA